MPELHKGRYRVRPALGEDDLRAAQRLRWLCFIGDRHGMDDPDARDADAHDALCRHLLIEDSRSGQLAGCFRLLDLESGADIDSSYSAQHYDLERLRAFPAAMIEIGRFCVHPAHSGSDILRTAWAALTRHVDAAGAGLLFGCSSFPGTDAAGYEDAFAMLRDCHQAPPRWLPRMRAPEVVRFPPPPRRPDASRARATMPPLLRSYLTMGGWVSDHAVMDRALGTIHVFTGMEVSAIPSSRARALRLLAG
ncbi:GNAT family N-acetyltransferase [Paracoccus sp. MC1862]|uniref:GNAT family N-acetyltransferase n=1 Tax=Paracoccus sp. MC1862 TaxID=2760307 RepID=UPI0016023AD6|nr:GNAT family N-acetyltransferase [Paracoccus sp. MC1862]MBB1497742.1 GNAT family N-acetyltransferase [Paracoccus sp. MC1862]QQO46270.1 GNAT family N-acetyltransferase [Paracoccus sp. MC1862]